MINFEVPVYFAAARVLVQFINMTNNQTFPILNVITENLRLSHGHVPVAPLCKGRDAEGDESDSVNRLGSVKLKRVINTHGTSFGVERICNRCQHVSGDCAESFCKFAQSLQKSDVPQHFCSRHRNSLQDDATTVREVKSFAFDSLDNFTNFGVSSKALHVNSGGTLLRSYEPSVKDKFCGQLANRTNEGLVRKDAVVVNHCRCGCAAAAQQVLCGLRSDSLLTGASDVRHSFPVGGESSLHSHSQAGLSKTIHSGCENRNPVGHNLSYKTNKVQGSDALPLLSHFLINSSAVNAWKPNSCLRHAMEKKLQDTVVMWWRYAPIIIVLMFIVLKILVYSVCCHFIVTICISHFIIFIYFWLSFNFDFGMCLENDVISIQFLGS